MTGALFLIADLISKQRGKAEDRYVIARKMKHGKVIGIAFFIAALTVVGMPPLSGFVGKVFILQAAQGMSEIVWVWPVVLLAGLASLVAISRAGTTIFWRYARDNTNDEHTISPLKLISVALLLSASLLLVVFGGPITDYTNLAAAQLHDTAQSVDALLPRGKQK